MPTFRDNLHIGEKDALIDSDSIADGSIQTRHIADGAVTEAKLDPALLALIKEKELVFVRLWDGSAPPMNNGTYAFIPNTNTLLQRVNNEWIAVEKSDRKLYLDCQHRQFYVWNGTEMVRFPSLKTINGTSLYGAGNIIVEGGGGGTPITIDDELDPTSHNPLSNYGVAKALEEGAGHVQADWDEQDIESPAYIQNKPNMSPKVPEFTGISDAEFIIENTGYSGEGGEIIYSTYNECFVLKVNIGLLQDKFYRYWDASETNLASTAYNENGVRPFANVLYALTGESLSLYMYSEDEGLIGITSGGSQVQSNWSQTNSSAPDYIKNKPTIDNVPIKNSNSLVKSGGVFDAIDSVQGDVDVNTQDIGRLNNKVSVLEGVQGDASDATLYPEYFLTAEEKANLRYCPNYYDWNTVWYNSDIETSDEVADVNAEVLYPSEFLDDTLPHVDSLRVLETQLVYPRTGQTELSRSWLSSTSASGSAITPARRVLYKLASASTNYAAGKLFKYEGLAENEVSQGTTISEGYIQVIDYTDSVPKRLLTSDVFYSTNLNQFVLKIGNVYYKHWNNSYLWNNENAARTDIVTNAHLRNDTVYCPIVNDEEGGVAIKHVGHIRDVNNSFVVTSDIRTSSYAENNTWVLHNGSRTPIRQTFTDFTEAIVQCLENNNGNMRLHSNKIYGMSDVNYESTPGASSTLMPCHELRNRSGFLIDGQNGTICFIDSMKRPPSSRTEAGSHDNYSKALGFYKCSNFTVQNLKIKCVRSSIQNSSSGRRFSHTNCPIYGLDILSCQHVYLNNIEFQGCCNDFQVKKRSSSDPTQTIVVFNGWKSNDSGGGYFGSYLKLLNIYNSYVKMNPLTSHHLLYNSSVETTLVENSTLINDSLYNTNFIEPKNADAAVHTDTYTDGETVITKYKEISTRFHNCHIQHLIGGVASNGYDVTTLEFDKCTIIQSNNRYHGKIGYWAASDSKGACLDISPNQERAFLYMQTAANVIFNDCDIATYGTIMLVSTRHRWTGKGVSYANTIQVTNNRITVLDIPNRQQYLYSNSHNKLFLNFDLGGQSSYIAASTVRTPARTFQGNITNCDILFEDSDNMNVPSSADQTILSKNLPVGYSYFNTTAGKPLWIVSIAPDGTYNWVDATGEPYTESNQQAQT